MFVRSRSGIWEVDAPAKLNFYLEVLGRRGDGYHALETLLFPVGLYDRLTFTTQTAGTRAAGTRAAGTRAAGTRAAGTRAAGTRAATGDSPNGGPDFQLVYHASTSRQLQEAAPSDEDNLVLRAGRLLAARAGVEARGTFELLKRIPVGAGMGGGSSDAAAALCLCNAAWGIGYSRFQLADLAAELGSDVPFFLSCRPAIGRGRGELLTLVQGMPRIHVALVVPPLRFMTAGIFGRLAQLPGSFASHEESSTQLARLTDLLRKGGLGDAGRWMINRLQSAASDGTHWIERVQRAFVRLRCTTHMMTGSGSGYFGVARSARHARAMAARLASWELGNVWALATGR